MKGFLHYYLTVLHLYIAQSIIWHTVSLSDSDLYGSRGMSGRYASVPIEHQDELPHAVSDNRCYGLASEAPERTTNFGTVRGRTVSLCDGPELLTNPRDRPYPSGGVTRMYKAVNVFLGIPYAEPPTKRNNLQFKAPRYPQRWKLINAVKYKPSCPQNSKYTGVERGINNTDEDCLYLNIYAPSEIGINQLFSVMMYIHGGNFDHGSANTFPAHIIASQNVIVVTFNYRLGHLGFLSTGDDASVGNYGILDQQLALKWVYENIRNFHGDPESITLFGFDAGAASASLLAISPLSRHMVKGVIAHNGVAVSNWAAISDRLFMFNTSRILGEALGCTAEEPQRIVECVGKRSNNEIRILEIKPLIGWIPWGPVVDNFTKINPNIFLPKSPEEMLEEGIHFKSGFRYMTGVSRDEGVTIMLADSKLRNEKYRVNENMLRIKIKDFMHMYNYSVNAEGIFNAISLMYKPAYDFINETKLRQGYMDLLTDHFYKAPMHKMGKLLVKKGIPTYLYVTNYTFEGYRPHLSWQGISSETDYLLLTGAPFMSPQYYPPYMNLHGASWTRADKEMSYFMIHAYTNFAKEGNPTPIRILNTMLWDPANKQNFWTLNVNSTLVMSEMINNYRERESEFWNCYLPFLIDREPPTLAPTLEPGSEELRVLTSAIYGTTSAAALFFIITVVCCILYCRARRYDSY